MSATRVAYKVNYRCPASVHALEPYPVVGIGVELMKIEKYGAGVFTVSDVLDEKECSDLIAYSEDLGFDGAVMEGLTSKEELYRENDRVFFTGDKLAETLYQRVEKFLPQEFDGW